MSIICKLAVSEGCTIERVFAEDDFYHADKYHVSHPGTKLVTGIATLSDVWEYRGGFTDEEITPADLKRVIRYEFPVFANPNRLDLMEGGKHAIAFTYDGIGYTITLHGELYRAPVFDDNPATRD